MLQRVAKSPGFIQHVSDAAGHARGKIAPGRAENDDPAAGHVFAAVIADGFDDRIHAGLRTPKRSPAMPRTKISPPVAP